MSLIKCSNCGNSFDDSLACCPKCGCPTGYNAPKEESTKTSQNSKQIGNINMKSLRIGLIAVAAVCLIISAIFFGNAYDVKNNYYNSENYSTLNENAYVGGDAYNYIINGTYFTGYSVTASAFLICGVILANTSINLTVRSQEGKNSSK